MSQGKSALSVVKKFCPSVVRVVDAKKTLLVKVLAKDCKSGKDGCADDCAMARACKREFDGAIVSKAVAYMIQGDTAFRYRVPSSVRTEIVSFDRNHDFRPGEYWLNAPITTERLGWLRKNRKPRVESKVKVARKVRRSHRPDGVRTL